MTMSEYPYDPWQKCKTKSGLAADEVISALQKEIRRNHAENAATLAYEMLITSEDMEEYLWFRLKTISVEDVGFGDLFAPVLVGMLDTMRKTFKQAGDRGLLAIHAVRFLCQCKKDRSSDEMYNWIIKEYAAGTLKPVIPEYALDKHTLRGQQAGKDENDFYAVSSQVSPEWADRDKTYRERVMKILADQKNA
jgi:replication-associated recombination protein RarA